MTRKEPSPPRDLGAAGHDLWRRVFDAFDLDPHELPGLLLACRQLDDVHLLEQQLESDGVVTTGSAGQPRLSAVVTELRQARLAAARLLDALALPVDGESGSSTPAVKRARRAAESRWAGNASTRRGTAAVPHASA